MASTLSKTTKSKVCCFIQNTILILFLLSPSHYLYAADKGRGMCDGQAPLIESELVSAIKALNELKALEGKASETDEESIVRGYGLTIARMNCILGKLMAGNDIFNWGGPVGYGVSLTPEERAIVTRYKDESLVLKKYMENDLNIKIEP